MYVAGLLNIMRLKTLDKYSCWSLKKYVWWWYMFPEHQFKPEALRQSFLSFGAMPQIEISLPIYWGRKQGLERLRQAGGKLQRQDPHPGLSTLPSLRNELSGNSLVVQWLELVAFTAGGLGSIPGRGTKILQAARQSRKKTKTKTHKQKTPPKQNKNKQNNKFQVTWRVKNRWKLSCSSLCLTLVLFLRSFIPSLLVSVFLPLRLSPLPLPLPPIFLLQPLLLSALVCSLCFSLFPSI